VLMASVTVVFDGWLWEVVLFFCTLVGWFLCDSCMSAGYLNFGLRIVLVVLSRCTAG